MRNDFFLLHVVTQAARKKKSESNQLPKRALTCLVPRRLSLDENVRAKEGGKETTLPTVCTFPMVPCGLSPVTRVSLLPLPCEKRSA